MPSHFDFISYPPQFNLKLPDEVEEYYTIKEKCIAAGWVPGQPFPPGQQQPPPNGPHRVMAQALMKRCIADIPIVTHIQKESTGMNKLYSQSMCSVNQWRAYQMAESLVSAEVEEVRAEADEIEPGWSQVSYYYHRNMTCQILCTHGSIIFIINLHQTLSPVFGFRLVDCGKM